MRFISMGGREPALSDDGEGLEDFDRDCTPVLRVPLGPVAAALEVWARKIMINMVYTPDYSLGAHTTARAEHVTQHFAGTRVCVWTTCLLRPNIPNQSGMSWT